MAQSVTALACLQVLFLSPARLVATTLGNNSVEVSVASWGSDCHPQVRWEDSEGGWRAPRRQLRLEEEAVSGTEVVRTEVGTGPGSVVLPVILPDRSYTLTFLPSGPRVPRDIGQVAVAVALLPGNLSFVAAVQLRSHVLWAGKLRVSWQPAVARGAGGRQRGADGYQLVLRSGQQPTFVASVTVPSGQTVHDFTGVELNQVYTVSLTCKFGDRSLACGTSHLSTAPPALVVGNTVYTQMGVARSWGESREECRAGAGYLVSLGNRSEEERVLGSVGASDVWTGGNMCPDSPAPLYSMWTDGSENSDTHFAPDSGLEGDHCCVKAGRSGWRGGLCSALLHGVCEFGVTGPLLANPGTLTAEVNYCSSCALLVCPREGGDCWR